MGVRIDPQVRAAALQLYSENGSPKLTAESLGLNRATVESWIKRGPGYLTDRGHKVSVIRQVLDMLDSGTPLKQIARETGHERATIRRWRDNPLYREATLEYDETFIYDGNDLLDRAVVAQHLCAGIRCDGRFKESGVRERGEMLMAVVGLSVPPEPDDSPARERGAPATRARVQSSVYPYEVWRESA